MTSWPPSRYHRAVADAEPVVVEVLDGPDKGLTIPLGDRSLPFRAGAGGSIAFAGAQRVKTTWYPGGGPASQQVSGETLDPTTMDGTWRDHLLGADGAAWALALAFERIRRGGYRIRMTWGRVRRVGLLARFDWRPGSASGGIDDLSWAAEFHWAATDDRLASAASAAAPAPESSAGAAEALSDLSSAVGLFVGRVEGLIGAGNAAFAASAATIEGLVEGFVPPIQAFAQAAQAGPRGDAKADRLVAPAANGARARVGELLEALDQLTPASTTDSDEAAVIITRALELADSEVAALDALAALYGEELRAEATSRPEATRTIRVVRGESWRALALRYYGDADVWHRLASYNGAAGGSQVPDDMVEVAIPEYLPEEGA